MFFFICSEEKSRLAARKYARVIQKLGFPVSSSVCVCVCVCVVDAVRISSQELYVVR